MKFKAGDKVERISELFDYGMKEGTLWVVQGYQGIWLNLEGVLDREGNYCCWDELNFKLYSGKESQEGVKYDSDKLEYSLLPKGVLTPILKVLSFGKKKYAADNWMKVDNPKERYYNAMQRHITQWWEGEKYDSETGENHLAHAACCLMFLLWFENKEDGNLKGKDN